MLSFVHDLDFAHFSALLFAPFRCNCNCPMSIYPYTLICFAICIYFRPAFSTHLPLISYPCFCEPISTVSDRFVSDTTERHLCRILNFLVMLSQQSLLLFVSATDGHEIFNMCLFGSFFLTTSFSFFPPLSVLFIVSALDVRPTRKLNCLFLVI